MNPPLGKLHDFVQPAPPSWVPHTIGWYLLFALLLASMAAQCISWIRRWKRDRYRHTAEEELRITATENLSALLKRTALAAWPRQAVAALSGDSWLRFLNSTTQRPMFDSAPGNEVEDCAMRQQPLSSADQAELRRLAQQWIRRHRVRV